MFLFFLIEFALGGPDPKLSDTPASITQLFDSSTEQKNDFLCMLISETFDVILSWG
jgi:hypothetical protein